MAKVCYTYCVEHIEVQVKIPFLWGKSVFQKNVWPHINVILGPNGSGKTLLAQAFAETFSQNGYSIKFLQAGRTSEDETLGILQTNTEVRAKVQAVLSSMFAKTIEFKKSAENKYVPMVINRSRNTEYDLKRVECHGLKEIITLLVTLYANTGNTCLIFDEPELHLHPQFQQFFAEELRRVSGRHPKRMYFIITHSPFFVDVRFPEELLGVIVCHTNRAPTHLDALNAKDEELFRRFLPRFNTYHKQFFFSDNQIFVEGYTDQQIFANLLPYIHTERGVAGTGIIDVGGKDELGVFCKVCSLLGTNSRIITDLDSLFGGKLRDVFCADPRAALWLEKQKEKQASFYAQIFTPRELLKPVTLERLIMRLERFLAEIGTELCRVAGPIPKETGLLLEKLSALHSKHEKAESIDTFKTVVLQGVMSIKDGLAPYLSAKTGARLQQVCNLFSLIIAASRAAGVYILPRGCIEHYYTQSSVHYMPVLAKDRLFHTERAFLLHASPETIYAAYKELLVILESACDIKTV